MRRGLFRIVLIAVAIGIPIGCGSDEKLTNPSDGANVVFEGWYANDGIIASGYVKNVGTVTASNVIVFTWGGGREWTNYCLPSSLDGQTRGQFAALTASAGAYPKVVRITWQ